MGKTFSPSQPRPLRGMRATVLLTWLIVQVTAQLILNNKTCFSYWFYLSDCIVSDGKTQHWPNIIHTSVFVFKTLRTCHL